MRKAVSVTLACAILLSLAFLPVPARAGSGTPVVFSFLGVPTSLAHGASGYIAIGMRVPEVALTVPATMDFTITSSGSVLLQSGLSVSGRLTMEPGTQTVAVGTSCFYQLGNGYAPAQVTLSWTVDTSVEGVTYHDAGTFTIDISHDLASRTVAPTCTEQGSLLHYCQICSYAYETDITPATGHDWGYWAHDEATSGAAATHTRVCRNDPAHTETEPCDFIINGPISAPTCTTDGAYWNLCKICSYMYINEVIPALGHDWGPWVHDASTSGAAATHTRTCSRNPSHTETEPCAYTDALTPPTCTEAGSIVHTCALCGNAYTDVIPAQEHDPGGWMVLTPPTHYHEGVEARYCTRCHIELERRDIPVLSMVLPDNTACSLGTRFRDANPALTDKWYMYTPVDLSRDGTLEIPLIASNRYIIGTVRLDVQGGGVTAAYEVTAKEVTVKEEFMTFFPGLASVTEVEPEALAGQALAFGAPVSIADTLGGGAEALFFMRLVVTYDLYAPGVTLWDGK